MIVDVNGQHWSLWLLSPFIAVPFPGLVLLFFPNATKTYQFPFKFVSLHCQVITIPRTKLQIRKEKMKPFPIVALWSLLLLHSLASGSAAANNKDHVLYTKHLPIQPSRLVVSCFENIPLRYRGHCRKQALDRFSATLYQDKRQCCSRWTHIGCLKEFLFNAIYCNPHQQQAVRRYLSEIDRFSLSSNGDCANYPPVERELDTLMESLGQLPRCIPRGIL